MNPAKIDDGLTAQARYHRRHKHELNANRNDRSSRNAAKEKRLRPVKNLGDGLHVQAGPPSPRAIYYIDASGQLHQEDHRSAAQLIETFLRAEARKNAPKKEGVPQ
jgi:hypothetical protein